MSTGFAELAARSHYSFLEGASSPRALVAAAAALGLPALGLCDRNGLYGAVAFVAAARAAGIHPVIGAELDLVDGQSIRLIARDRAGYQQLSRAISAAQLAGEKGQPRLDLRGEGWDFCAMARRKSWPGGSPPEVRAQRADEGEGWDFCAMARRKSWPGGSPPEVTGTSTRPRRARPTLPPPERPTPLRPTAGPFPEGWPGLPSTTLLNTAEPARIDPAELRGCTVLAGGSDSAITRALVAGDRRAAARWADRLREAFGRDHVYLLLSHHLHPADTWLCAETAWLAARTGIPLLASNTPVHATVDDKPLLDSLCAIRHRTTLDGAAAHGLLLPNAEHRLKSEAELRALLGEHPEAFDHALHLATQCSVALDFSDVRFPGFPVPDGETPFSVLYRLCQEAVQRKYHPVTRTVASRLQRELEVIEKTGLAEFFLITWDIMRFARENRIPGQGRGSAADSIVAYLLGVTRVDPVAHDLLFERFLHEDHQGTPDIDIDFSTEHREQVLQYVYERYGAERTGMVANVVTYRPRMAVRQVGAALGFPETIIDRLAKSVDGWYPEHLVTSTSGGPAYHGEMADALRSAGIRGPCEGEIADALGTAGIAEPSLVGGARGVSPRVWRQFLHILAAIEGTPRHLSIHVGGMLVTGAPLVDVVPVERATMPGRVVVQFNKDDVEDLGLIKMDLLGLRTLGAVAECLDHIEATTGRRADLDALGLDDPAVYDMICEPDTIGLFQIESRAQQQSLYQSQPREFNDLIVQVAIIRPGPIQGNAVHPYLRRRQGLELVTYLHPSLEPILAETRGVVLYQEQILRIVMEVAGYTAGEADRFRRAMNRHRSRVEMQGLHDEFVGRCAARDIPAPVAEEIFKAVAGFAQFGFCKSHAAAFARTAYETGWLRLHHPAAWLCSLLNAQPMGFYHPSVLVEDGKRHGVRSLPVDVTRSGARCTLEWVGEGPPPAFAVAAGLAPGWRLGPAGAVELDPAERTWATRGERSAARAVAAASRSGWPPSPWAVRLGYGYVRGLGPEGRAACAEAAAAGATGSVAEFWRHTLLHRPAMENLIMVGAFDSVAGPLGSRRALLWELREAEDVLPPRRRRAAATAALPADEARLDLDGGAPAPDTAEAAAGAITPSPPRGRAAIAGRRPGDSPRLGRDATVDPVPPLLGVPAPAPPLPAMTERDHTDAEYRVSELSTGLHLVAHLRTRLEALGCVQIADVPHRRDGEPLRVGGLVVARQAPMSAKGFRFFTLADEGGHLDLVFRPDIARATRSVANFHPLLVVDGTLQAETGRLNLLVTAVHAIDGEGNLIANDDAIHGKNAATTAPPPQHGFTRPVTTTPASHDFR